MLPRLPPNTEPGSPTLEFALPNIMTAAPSADSDGLAGTFAPGCPSLASPVSPCADCSVVGPGSWLSDCSLWPSGDASSAFCAASLARRDAMFSRAHSASLVIVPVSAGFEVLSRSN